MSETRATAYLFFLVLFAVGLGVLIRLVSVEVVVVAIGANLMADRVTREKL